MVTFDAFWNRLKKALSDRPPLRCNEHYQSVRKWSQDNDYFDGSFVLIYQGGDTLTCDTATTEKARILCRADFEKVYSLWDSYRRGRTKRNEFRSLTHNASYIIPVLREYESLMERDM